MPEPKQELSDLRLPELSLVDTPANDEEFPIYKSMEANMSAEKTAQTSLTAPLEVITKGAADLQTALEAVKKSGGQIPEEVKKNFKSLVEKTMPLLGEATAGDSSVEKGQAQFSKERKQQMANALGGMAAMYKEVDPEGFADMMRGWTGDNRVQESNGKPPASGIMDLTKNADIVKSLSDSLAETVKKGLEPIQTGMSELVKRVEKLESEKGVSKALPPNGTDTPVTKAKESFWKGTGINGK